MAWVESHQEIGGHPKTKKAAKRLGVNVPQMVGHLHLLWHWALAYADDGDLSRWDDDDVALGAQWDGDSSEFVRALVDVGFIDEADGSRWLHDWMDYAGRLVRERERKRAARSKPQDTDPPPDDHASAACPQTGGGQDGDDPRAGTNPTNQPDPTEPNQPAPAGGDPPANGHDSRRLAERWRDYARDELGLSLPEPERTSERFRVVFEVMLDETSEDDRHGQVIGFVADYIEVATGDTYKVSGDERSFLARVVGEFPALRVFDAAVEGVTWGAGTGEYADHPRAVVSYMRSVLGKEAAA